MAALKHDTHAADWPSGPDDALCLAEWFRRRADEAPGQPILTFQGQTWSRGKMYGHIRQLSGHFAKLGVRAGDRVAYYGFDHPILLAALFAAARIGAIFVPLNFRLSPAELVDIVNDAGIHTMIVDEVHEGVAERNGEQLGCRAILCVAAIVSMFEAGPAQQERPEVETGAVSAAETALLMYTSGTTGRPKGVMLTHRNMWMSNVTAILANAFNSRDVGLNCAPLFHAAGLNTLTMPLLMAGGHLVLQPAFDPAEFLAAVAAHKVTVSLLVPTMMTRICQHDDFGTTDLSSMRLLMSGGAPVPKPVLQTYNDRGILTNQGYGMTETTSAVVILRAEHAIDKMGSCGRPTMLTDVKLVDANGQDVREPHIPGEIWMRGPTVAGGYWQRPAETAVTFDTQGWLHSGDVGYFDEDGFYYICDRLKDMIISGGENIYAAEVEAVLHEHPGIAEVAVIGTLDSRWGECVTAIVVRRTGQSVDLPGLSIFAEGRLARYKLPKILHFIDELPHTSTGKIAKAELRAKFG